MSRISIFVVVVYAIFVFVGGLIGFLKAQSNASLIMGSIFAILLFLSAGGMWKGMPWSYFGALACASFLLFFFGYRYFQSLRMMPAGLMVLLSIIVLISLLFEKMFYQSK